MKATIKKYVKRFLAPDQRKMFKSIIKDVELSLSYKQLNTFRYKIRNFILSHSDFEKPYVNNKKVSIIVPTLSKGKQADHLVKLRRLLSTYLPEQSHNNYEVIVVCDGSNAMVGEMVNSLDDKRIRKYATASTVGKWGHPQTRIGIEKATGDFFVRLNDDNVPHRNYLSCLLSGFDEKVGIVYGRVVFDGEARREHDSSLGNSFVIPGDKRGELKLTNVDCMCYMVRMNFAKQYVQSWNDRLAADWFFLEGMLKDGVKTKFIDRIIGEKF